MSDFSDSIAFSDLTLTSKLILLLGWLIKSAIFCFGGFKAKNDCKWKFSF